jgi:superfamily II DNA or RNA helicase
MSVINNQEKFLQEELKTALVEATNFDVLTGFFFFSGFSAIVNELRDKKIRILVGLQLDPKFIPLIATLSKAEDVDLSAYQVRGPSGALSEVENFKTALVGLMNDSEIFESDETSRAFDTFIEKVETGSLEIKKTSIPNHSKLYLVDGSPQLDGKPPKSVAFMGSSNFSFKGLVGQGELNDRFDDPGKVAQYRDEFERLWNDARAVTIVDAAGGSEFAKDIKKRIWKTHTPTPYKLYVRALHEFFLTLSDVGVATPSKITSNKFWDLAYQVDAIKLGISKIQSHSGVIIADVTGLGKSIIASSIAFNLRLKTVVFSPPHLKGDWEGYLEKFNILGGEVFSIGSLEDAYIKLEKLDEPILVIVDEAHRFRNESTIDYGLLHKICRLHAENKVIALTATPFNNAPSDFFSLVRLFQSPGASTIQTVGNVAVEFRELMDDYQRLRKVARTLTSKEIDEKSQQIALKQRRMLEPVVIRRSRLDILGINRYREDLERQNMTFADVKGPFVVEYDLGSLEGLYSTTLQSLVGDGGDALTGARYKPTSYLKDEDEFLKAYGRMFAGAGIVVGQKNNADNNRRLLVMRFESSKEAFRRSLSRMMTANQSIVDWWDKQGAVPIQKRGLLPDPESVFDGEEVEEDMPVGSIDTGSRNLVVVNKDFFTPEFIKSVRNDSLILQRIYDDWFGESSDSQFDPKIEKLMTSLGDLLRENPTRKIVIFSSYADTVNYLFDQLHERGFTRSAKYTAEIAKKSLRDAIKNNFDASVRAAEQVDDFDILVATDALSEGFNLHRAGVIINYDIPYNPTRVVQRVGRINRIDRRLFDEILIYNFFPTSTGEGAVNLRGIATLKMRLINATVGSDHRTLTSDEDIQTFFKDTFESAQLSIEGQGWDDSALNDYDLAKKDAEIMNEVAAIPRRVRIRRAPKQQVAAALFGKKGKDPIFAIAREGQEPEIVGAEEILSIFKANIDEPGLPVTELFDKVFEASKTRMFGSSSILAMKGKRQECVKHLEYLKSVFPQSENFCRDLIVLIRDLDDVPDVLLSDILESDLSSPAEAFEYVKAVLPEAIVTNVLTRARVNQGLEELLLLAEEFES